MSNPDQIIGRMNELTDFIKRAQEKLKNGDLVDLSHLDAEVSKLCDITLAMKQADAMKIQPAMADMITQLEQLGIQLKDFQNSFKPTGGAQ